VRSETQMVSPNKSIQIDRVSGLEQKHMCVFALPSGNRLI